MPLGPLWHYLRVRSPRLLWTLVAILVLLFAYPFLRPHLPDRLKDLAATFLWAALIAVYVAGLFVGFTALLIDVARLRRWKWLKSRVRRGLCPKCGYDLRGTVRECPECGADAVAPRLAVAVAENDEDDPHWPARAATAAAAAECPVAALAFVRHALWYADLTAEAAAAREQPSAADAIEGPAPDVPAADLCRAVAAIAPASLGGRAAAAETLSRWGLRRGEDVGRLLYAMIESGLLRASERDSRADFAGAFELERDV